MRLEDIKVGQEYAFCPRTGSNREGMFALFADKIVVEAILTEQEAAKEAGNSRHRVRVRGSDKTDHAGCVSTSGIRCTWAKQEEFLAQHNRQRVYEAASRVVDNKRARRLLAALKAKGVDLTSRCMVDEADPTETVSTWSVVRAFEDIGAMERVAALETLVGITPYPVTEFQALIQNELARGAAPAIATGAVVSALLEQP